MQNYAKIWQVLFGLPYECAGARCKLKTPNSEASAAIRGERLNKITLGLSLSDQ